MNGIEFIAVERARQIQREGWTHEHDDRHTAGELAITAACYAVHHTDANVKVRGADAWPFGSCEDKRMKHPTIKALAIAGALIAAEIDRLQRHEASQK